MANANHNSSAHTTPISGITVHALGEFSVAYADQNDADYAEFVSAIASGDVPSAERPR